MANLFNPEIYHFDQKVNVSFKDTSYSSISTCVDVSG